MAKLVMARGKSRWMIVLVIVLAYGIVLFRNLHEYDMRSLSMQEKPCAGDCVRVSVRVLGVDLNNRVMRLLISFRPTGKYADRSAILEHDFTLYVNALRGDKEFHFASGQRMNPIEVEFPLNGDINRYPFDRYRMNLWLLLTSQNLKSQAAGREHDDDASASAPLHATDLSGTLGLNQQPMPQTEGMLATSADELDKGVPEVGPELLQKSDLVPISIDIKASMPGIKFSGRSTGSDATSIEEFELSLRRTDQVISVSITLMTMILAVAVSLLIMVVTVRGARDDAAPLLPLAVSVSLLFGLPALRNVQPNAPPVGVLGDYICFIWAEMIVAVSTVIAFWTVIARARRGE